MICYRDMTFCCRNCGNELCPRNYTHEEAKLNTRNWPVSVADLRTDDCGYVEVQEVEWTTY